MGVRPLAIEALEFKLAPRAKHPAFWQAVALAERLLSAVLLLLLLPLLALVAAVVLALSRRPPFIAHQRIGRGGKAIWIIKLRTMWDASSPSLNCVSIIERVAPDRDSPVTTKTRRDPRVTSRFATWCRRFSIDELPQLWHVFRGEMALIGPRPLTAQEIETHYGSAANQLLSRKPGLSGLWQVKGRSRLSYLQRRRLDLFLIRKWSPGLYLKILLATFPSVFAGKDAW